MPDQSSQDTANPLPQCQPSANLGPIHQSISNQPIQRQSFTNLTISDQSLPIFQSSVGRTRTILPIHHQSVNPLPILVNPGSIQCTIPHLVKGTSTIRVRPKCLNGGRLRESILIDVPLERQSLLPLRQSQTNVSIQCQSSFNLWPICQSNANLESICQFIINLSIRYQYWTNPVLDHQSITNPPIPRQTLTHLPIQ